MREGILCQIHNLTEQLTGGDGQQGPRTSISSAFNDGEYCGGHCYNDTQNGDN